MKFSSLIFARVISSDFTRLARIFAVARFSASPPSELQYPSTSSGNLPSRIVALLFSIHSNRRASSVSLPFLRNVEHVLLRNEAEGVGRVCFLLRNDRKSYRHQPQKQGKKSDFSAHINLHLLSLSSPKIINVILCPKD